MRLKTRVFLSMLVLSLSVANTGKAGYYVKKQPAKITVATANPPEAITAAGSATAAGNEVSTTTVEKVKMEKKPNFFTRLIHKAKEAEISKGLYIVLAIFALGWLGMGINDNFSGFDWIISLVLYILFWLPGLIYTLVKMKKYY